MSVIRKCSRNETHSKFNTRNHKCLDCGAQLKRYCSECDQYFSSANFARNHKHPTLNIETKSDISQNDCAVKIVEGWPCHHKATLISDGKTKINQYSKEGKKQVAERLWNVVKEYAIEPQMIAYLRKQGYKVMTSEQLKKQLDVAKIEGANIQKSATNEQHLNYAHKACGLMSKNSQKKLRNGHILAPNQVCSQQPTITYKRQTLPHYFTTEVSEMIATEVELQMQQSGKVFLKLNKTKVANIVAAKLVTERHSEMIIALKSRKGGYFATLAYGQERNVPLNLLFSKRIRRKYNRSALGVTLSTPTENTKRRHVQESLLHGLNYSDEEILSNYETDKIYIGEIVHDEKDNYSVVRELRAVMGELLLKLYYENGFTTKSGEVTLDILEWGDGSKLLASGFFVAAFMFNATSSFFSKNAKIQSLLRQWIPYYLSFMAENTENMNYFMSKRKEMMERLALPFKIGELTIHFNLSHYIGDLSHLWKMFLINMTHCAHCVQHYHASKDFLKGKLSKRRSVSNLILSEIFKREGLDKKSLSLHFSDFERKCNTKTVCDILHSLKGAIKHLQTLMEQFDGIDHQIMVDLQLDILNKGDVSLLSGGDFLYCHNV